MTTQPNSFEELEQAAANGDAALLDCLAAQSMARQEYHELFEVRKMQARHAAGLPLLYGDDADDLSGTQRTQLEDGLLAACREVGLLLFDAGQIREGWMYMRPVGDNDAVAAALSKVEVDDDNLDDLVEITLHEGVDVERGFALILEHFGTCNSITTFDQVMPNRSRTDQQIAAGLLVEHLHAELLAAVRSDIASQQGSEPKETTLTDLVKDRDWLFGEHTYHIDTTHLASTVRFARLLDNPGKLTLALDLTAYGLRLNEMFQHPDREPFADVYSSSRLYFQALLGENQDDAVAYFRDKAVTVDHAEHGALAIEVYIDLLARLERYSDAMDAALQYPEDAAPVGIAPPLLTLAQKADRLNDLAEYYRSREDLMGYATALLHSR